MNNLIYVANQSGILEFNGVSWKKYKIPNNISRVVHSHKSEIYIGGLNEIGRLKPISNGIMKYESLTKLIKQKDQSFGYIWYIHSINENIYFVGRKKVFVYDGQEIKSFSFNNRIISSFKIDNKLVVSAINGSISIINHNNTNVIKTFDTFFNKGIQHISKTSNGKWLIMTVHHGLYIYDHKKLRTLNKTSQVFFKETYIHNVTQLSSGNFAISTSSGLVIMNASGEIKKIYDQENGLLNNSINHVFEDTENNLWVSSSHGISTLLYQNTVSYYPYFKDKVLLELLVKKDTLYLGTNKGIYLINTNGLNEKSFPHILENSHINNLYPFQNRVLISSATGLYSLKDSKIKQIETINALSTHRSNNYKNRFYTHLRNSFAIHEVSSNNEINKIYDGDERLGSISSIVEENNQHYWVGTFNNGLFSMKFGSNLENPQVEPIKPFKEKIESTVHVFNYHNTNLFLMKSGLYEYNDKRNEFLPSTRFKNTKMSSFSPYFIDHATKHIYYIYNEKVYKQGEKGEPYPIRHLNPINSKTYYKIFVKNGILWILNQEGLYKYNSNIQKNIDKTYPVSITEITLNQDSLLFGGFHPPGKNSHTFTIGYSQNQLRFQYAAAYYEMPKRTTYSYKLEGYDTDWSIFSSETSKDYTGLFEGTYTFKVRAKNVYETLGTTANYTFTILPPWYRSIWAYIIYVLIFLFMSYLFNALITSRKIKRLNEQRRIEIAEGKARESELKIQIEKERMRTRISEDLHDEIGSNLSYIQLMSEVLEKRNNTSGDQKEFKHVSESASEMSQAMRDIVWFVKPENDTYEMFINKLSEVTEKFLDPFELSFSTEIEHLDRNLDINIKRNIYLILKEILQNIIKHSEAKQIKVLISDKNEMFRIFVKDDGIGFDPSLNKRGNGLINYQKRAEKINGNVFVSTRIGEGTEITLEVKL